MTSCRPAPDACRLAWMAGAATFTTDASSSAMNWPVRTIARIQPGLGAARWAGRAGPAVMRVLVMEPSLPPAGSRYQEHLATAGGPRQDGCMSMVTTANGQQRRAELAAFLRSRRERISPEQAGLAPSTRRRTPGLRREEVAQLAGVGVTWYTWLEQGRQINASTQVLGAVARTLLLDPAEREHLFRLADVPDAVGAAAADDGGCEQVPADVQQILDALVPLPASVLNERFDLLAWNAAYEVLWPSVVGREPAERNVLWLNFTHAECCHPYVNRDSQLSTLVAQLRGAYGRHLGEPAWTGFVRRLQARSPHFARLWD